METTMSEMINTLDRINRKLDITEKKISESEDIEIKLSKMKQRKKTKKKECLLWDNFEQSCVGVLQFLKVGEEKCKDIMTNIF